MTSIGSTSVAVLGDSCQYSAWCMKIRCILEVEEVDDVVYGSNDGTSTQQEAPKAEGVAGGTSGNQTQQGSTGVTGEFKKKDARARMVLTCALDAKHIRIIEACKTSREIWTRLEQEYAASDPTTTEALMSAYYAYRMDETKTISEYISHIDSLVGKLEAVGKPQDKEAVLAKIVSGLPEEYSALRRAWDLTPAQFKSKQLLITNLKKEEEALKGKVGEAKIARASGKRDKNFKRRNNNRDKKKGGKCHCCDSPDHWWRDCPNRSPDWRPPKGSSKKEHQTEKPKSSAVERACMATYGSINKDESLTWYLDSGASSHMTSRFDWLDNYVPYSEGYPIRVGNGELVYAKGKGTVLVISQVKDREFKIRFRNVQYVPDISDKLISIGVADAAGWEIRFGSGKVAMIDNCGDIAVLGHKVTEQIYKPNVKVPMRASIHRSVRTLEEWHRSLGHPSMQTIATMVKSGCATGMAIDNNSKSIEGCGECQQGRCKKTSHPSSQRERATKILERVHADLVGPVTPTSIGGAKHFLLLKDEYSSFMFVEFMATKAHTVPLMKGFVNNIGIRTHNRVSCFRTDQGSEFTSNEMKSFCLQEGIVQEFSAACTPEQNGEAERANRVVIEMGRTNLIASRLELGLWAEAINYAVYSRNLIPCSRSNGVTPFEKFYGRKPITSSSIRSASTCTNHEQTLVQVRAKDNRGLYSRIWSKGKHISVFQASEQRDCYYKQCCSSNP